MPRGILAFFAGVLLFQQLPDLPSAWWLAGVPLFAWPGWRFPFLRLPLLAAAGFCWALLHAHLLGPAELPRVWLGKVVEAEGRIAGLPRCTADRCTFFFEARRLVSGTAECRGRWRLRLTWYRQPPGLAPGDRWRLAVKLKPVVGYRNPGSFDYAGWLHARGVRYRGYVRGEGKLLERGGWSLDRLRQEISRGIEAGVESPRAAAVMRALAVGDRGGLTSRDRNTFAATGTSHLVAISGLHVGLVAGLAWLLGAFLWRRVPALCARWPARVAAAPLATGAATAYAALAGFSLPTQRALLMLLVVAVARVARRHARPGSVLATALLAVLLWDPAAVREAGFWLSFGAVAILLAFSRAGGRWRWFWLQLALSLGLLPVLSWQQMPLSLLSPLVNLAAIPLFSLVVIPGTLLAVALEWLLGWPGGPWLQAMAWLLERVLEALDRLARWNPPLSGHEPWLWAGAWLLALLLAWRLRVGSARHRGAVLALLALFGLGACIPSLHTLPPGHFELTLLDVGQGLSAVVRTRNHLLVYDTGPAFPSGFDTGSAVVAPYLKTLGAVRVDRLVLSHGDSDHTGGARGLLARIAADEILAGEPRRLHLDRPVVPCRAGDRWWWDGVRFQVISPAPEAGLRGNDASCVLRISSGGRVLLLTGDIEAAVEEALVTRHGRALRSDLVVAAHHGSASSSTPAFVAATRPAWVLFSSGPGNRWGFPKERVVERWCAAGARPLDTAWEGAIRLRFAPGLVKVVERYARDHGRYWRPQMGRQKPVACSMIAPIEDGG